MIILDAIIGVVLVVAVLNIATGGE